MCGLPGKQSRIGSGPRARPLARLKPNIMSVKLWALISLRSGRADFCWWWEARTSRAQAIQPDTGGTLTVQPS